MEEQTKAEKEFSLLVIYSDTKKVILKAIKSNTVWTSVIGVAIVAAIGFGWKNVDPPAVKQQIDNITTVVTTYIKTADEKDKKRDIDVEVLKTNSANTITTVSKLSDKQDKDHDLLIQMNATLNAINKNTK